jgi:hypothetical protein
MLARGRFSKTLAKAGKTVEKRVELRVSDDVAGGWCADKDGG